MAFRPAILPTIDRNNTNTIDWALSPLQYSGYQPGQVVPSAPHNTLWRLGSEWLGYLDYGTVRASDYLDTTIAQRWSFTRLAYALGQEIDVDGAQVTSYATYFVGGFRIEIDHGLLRTFGASPLLMTSATLPGRVWLYLDHGVIADPGQPVAMVRIVSMDVGALPEPNAGEIALVGVDVDANGKVTGNTYADDDPALGITYALSMPQTFPGAVTIGDLAASNAVVGGGTQGLEVRGAPVSWHTHPSPYPWTAEFRAQTRTFAVGGNVPPPPYDFRIRLTANEPDQYKFADIPPTCIVVFWYRLAVFVGNSNALADGLSWRTQTGGATMSRQDGIWGVGGQTATPANQSGPDIANLFVPSQIDPTIAELLIDFSAAHAGMQYRVIAEVTAHVMMLD
jgi:hypothetical protein